MWLLILLASASSTWASDARYIPAVEPPVRILEDPAGELDINDIVRSGELFSANIDSSVNFGFTQSAYWFSTQVQRPASGHSVMLKVSYSLLDHIDLYVLSDNGRSQVFKAGDSLPFRERFINHRAFVFPLDFEADDDSLNVYMRVKTTSAMQVPVSLWQPEAFHAESYDEQVLLGLYYGLLLAIMVSNAMMALSVREPAYAYYAVYILFYAGFQMCVNGLAFEYLWPSSTYLAEKGTVLCMAFSAAMATAFSVEILELRRQRGLLRLTLFTYGFVNLFSVILCLTMPYAFAIQLQTLLVSFGTILFFCAGIVQLKRGVAVARYFLMAWSMFLLGIAIYGLKTYAILPENLFTEYAIQVGSALETLLLSFAIAHRFKVLREEKLRLQRESTELLEMRVTERTLALENTLEELSAANSRLETLSIVDTLSGVFNRAYFNANFERMWEAARTRQKPIAILMIDIDHFKQVNDNHGHLIGDDVITIVSKLVSQTVSREEDFVARYGGEEFAVVLPDTELQTAMSMAEKIRAKVNAFDSDVEAIARVGRISVSIGVAGKIPEAEFPDMRSEMLLSEADNALYDAKNSGRNRVCQAVNTHSPLHPGTDRGLRALRLG